MHQSVRLKIWREKKFIIWRKREMLFDGFCLGRMYVPKSFDYVQPIVFRFHIISININEIFSKDGVIISRRLIDY